MKIFFEAMRALLVFSVVVRNIIRHLDPEAQRTESVQPHLTRPQSSSYRRCMEPRKGAQGHMGREKTKEEDI